jgi:uncharacterized LabA/DUF88 family protein
MNLAEFPRPAAATFVDAGWLLASAGLLVNGSPRREDLWCNYGALLPALGRYVEQHSEGMRLLRTYWYDGAVGGVATTDHKRIAGLPYVTVQLGRLSSDRQQKGVDSKIYRDLMKLARERAVARVYLVAGDEDLRIGVTEAKEMGVQVVLLGMPVEDGQNQSALLVRECDEYVSLPAEVWREHFARREDAEEPDDENVALARRIGRSFAREWVDRVSGEEAKKMLGAFPTVPSDLDIELVTFAERDLGSLRQRPDLKQELRGSFWFELREAT